MADNLETTVAFWYLAIAAVAAGVIMLAARNPVHSAISLVTVIFHVAGLFVILGAGFLAVAQIAIYAGAIVVLFLFTLMMLDMRRLPEERVTHRQIWLGIPLGDSAGRRGGDRKPGHARDQRIDQGHFPARHRGPNLAAARRPWPWCCSTITRCPSWQPA